MTLTGMMSEFSGAAEFTGSVNRKKPTLYPFKCPICHYPYATDSSAALCENFLDDEHVSDLLHANDKSLRHNNIYACCQCNIFCALSAASLE